MNTFPAVCESKTRQKTPNFKATFSVYHSFV